MSGTLKTAFLLGVLTLVFIYIGRLLGGTTGMTIALVIALIMNFMSYWFSDKIVLAMYHAREVTPEEAPRLYNMVRNVATQAGIPMPRLYIIPTQAPNAFATGRNPQNAAVAVTEGILKLLEPGELEGVIAHEIGHIANRDILISTVAATLAGAISYIANMAQWAFLFGGFGRNSDDEGHGGVIGSLIMIVLAPIIALIIQLAISRAREYKADETGARLTRRPLDLASALKKISYGAQRIPLDASPGTAHLFIMNPLRGGLAGLFSTHPPVEERIERLERMAREGV
ncbi:MAG TPA: zinc metalloprotease HtpX [Thermodesulfobacteriota bacterium]|jgi:heat shock protein HtpX|nr:zinc metalloprotease HtpX [Thermodesulfobacteriota bacterium]